MALHPHQLNVLGDLHRSRDLIQHREAALHDHVAVGLEVHRLAQLNRFARHQDQPALVGTAVGVVHAIQHLGFDRAGVFLIADAIEVVVGFRAAVFILPAVKVLGLGGASVVAVQQAVAVVVGIRAAVLVFEAVHILGHVGALVVTVQQAVAVVVLVGAPVLVFEAVAVFGNVHAGVALIRNAIAVEVFVGHRRRPIRDAREHPKVGSAKSTDQASAKAALHLPSFGDVKPRGREQLDGHLFVANLALEQAKAQIQLGHQMNPVVEQHVGCDAEPQRVVHAQIDQFGLWSKHPAQIEA